MYVRRQQPDIRRVMKATSHLTPRDFAFLQDTPRIASVYLRSVSDRWGRPIGAIGQHELSGSLIWIPVDGRQVPTRALRRCSGIPSFFVVSDNVAGMYDIYLLHINSNIPPTNLL